MERDFSEDWVHDTGRLVLVGDAAHPFPVRCSPPFWQPFLIDAHSPEFSLVRV